MTRTLHILIVNHAAQAYTAWCATTSNIPPAHAAEASAGKLDYLFTELDEGYDSDSDSMPSLESLSGSESEY